MLLTLHPPPVLAEDDAFNRLPPGSRQSLLLLVRCGLDELTAASGSYLILARALVARLRPELGLDEASTAVDVNAFVGCFEHDLRRWVAQGLARVDGPSLRLAGAAEFAAKDAKRAAFDELFGQLEGLRELEREALGGGARS